MDAQISEVNLIISDFAHASAELIQTVSFDDASVDRASCCTG